MIILPIIASALTFAASTLARSTPRNPINALAIVQNATIHHSSRRVHYLSEFEVSFRFFDQAVKLTLEPNHDIIANGATYQVLGPDGEVIRSEPIQKQDHRVFKGTAWFRRPDEIFERAGDARIYVHRDGRDPSFSGTFSVDGETHHIQTSTDYMKTKHSHDPDVEISHQPYMVLWRDSDVMESYEPHSELRRRDKQDYTCRSNSLQFNMAPEHPVYAKMLRRDQSFWSASVNSILGKRQSDVPGGGNSGGGNLIATIGSSVGCESARRVALVGVAMDCTYTGAFASQEEARNNVFSSMNQASAVYERTFNLSLGIQNLTVMDANCPGTAPANVPWNIPCSGSVSIEDRLNLFSTWRGQQSDSNSHWTLLSTCGTGSAVGLAWLGQSCRQGSEANGGNQNEQVAGANVVVRTEGGLEWQIIAHETGHTFGAVHDCAEDTCNDGSSVRLQECCPLSEGQCDATGRFIMNPSTGRNINDFSQCTIGNICSGFNRRAVSDACFVANNEVSGLITEQQCGNGIVESGEECDCGGETGCAGNSCCDPQTCRFINNAVCDDSNEDCCNNCQLSSAQTICRASTSACDPEERCSGTSPYCPSDVMTPDGDDCGNGRYCASGQCTNRNEQCQTVMGPYVRGNASSLTSCNPDSCQLSCESSDFSSQGFGSDCQFLQQSFFLDGTDCGSGGRCSNGRCEGSSFGNQVSDWIDRHKDIVIGVSCGVGGLLLICILWSCIRCCRRRRKRSKAITPPPPMANANGFYGARTGQNERRAPPPYPRPPSETHQQAGWLPQRPNQQGWNGPMPPPARINTGSSVRYA